MGIGRKERRRKRHTSKVAPRTLPSDADARTQKRCGERAKNRALARDLERLIEECETLLQQQKGGGFRHRLAALHEPEEMAGWREGLDGRNGGRGAQH